MDGSRLEDTKRLTPQEKRSVQHNLEKEPLRTGIMESEGVSRVHDPHVWSGRALALILVGMVLLLGLAVDYMGGRVVTWYVEKALEVVLSHP